MRTTIFFISLFAGLASHAEIGMDFQQLKSRLELKAETFVVSSDGTKIFDTGATSMLNFGKEAVRRGWIKLQYKDLKEVNLSFVFTVNEDRSLKLEVTEWEKSSFDNKAVQHFSGEIRKQTYAIKNFESVEYVTKGSDTVSLVTRFSPQISSDVAEQLKTIPMSFSNAIFTDNAGRVWSEGVGGTSEAAGVTTAYGTIYFSFIPFQGAKEIGSAKGQVMNLDLTDKMTVRVRSASAIIGSGYVAKVYGTYFPDRKGPSSVTSMSIQSLEKTLSKAK